MYLAFLIIIAVFIYSCSDDLVTSVDPGPYQFDSARYEWTTDTLYSNTTRRIFGLDSNHIYLSDNQSMFIYDGTNYSQHIISDMLFREVGGLDPNNIYIAGSYFNGDYRLEKWNGSGYENIPAPSDTSQSLGFISILVRSSNEIWLGAQGGIFLYNGINFTKYKIDSSDAPFMFTENDGRLLAIVFKINCPDSSLVNCDRETVIYEFTNNNWIKINSTVSNADLIFYPVKIGTSVFGNSKEGIFKLSNNEFYKYLNSPAPYSIANVAGGKDMNDFMTVTSHNEVFYIHWNGNRLSREMSDPRYLKDIEKINNNYYTLVEDCNWCNYVLFRKGKLK